MRIIELKIVILIFSSKYISQLAPVVKTLPANAGDLSDEGSIPGSGRSPREGNGNPHQ